MFTYSDPRQNEEVLTDDIKEAVSKLSNYIEILESNPKNSAARRNAIVTLSKLSSQGMKPRDEGIAGHIMRLLFPHTAQQMSGPNHSELIRRALDHVTQARKLAYPNGLTVSPWWAVMQERFMAFCSCLNNPVDIISFAQCTHLSGSDRRIYDDPNLAATVVMDQMKKIEQSFGICVPIDLPIEDSDFSIRSSLCRVAGKNYSNSFMNMLGYYLGCREAFTSDGVASNVLEIGAGYGSLARIIKTLHPGVRYTIVDIPESLLFSYVFLSMNFPSASTLFVTDEKTFRALDRSDHDFIFVPAQLCSAIYGRTYELTINTGSMQEMPKQTVEFFSDVVQNKINCRFFYSFNYFINARSVLPEWSQADYSIESSNLCPALDPWWRVRTFRLNPSHLTVDCKGRNWLEILVERIEHDKRDDVTLPDRADALIREANLYPVMSDKWIECLWAGIWVDPRSQYVQKIIVGLELFTKGWRVPNHMFSGEFGSPATPDASWKLREELFSKIEEVNFYKRLRDHR